MRGEDGGLGGRKDRFAPLLRGAVAAAGGRQKGPAVPEEVVVVAQGRQQGLGLGADARVLAGRAGAALAVAEGVEVGGGQRAGGDVGEGEAAAAAGGRLVSADLSGHRRRGCDLRPRGQGPAGPLSVQGGRRRVEFGDCLFTPAK